MHHLRLKFSFELLLAFVVGISHFYAAAAPETSLMNWYTTDDAFYYFKTAQNISEGFGVSFDRIGRASGFHPLWMVVCIPVFALARFDLILPLRILVMIMALLNAGSGILLYRLLSRRLSVPTARLAAIFWVFFPTIQGLTTQLGMESGINAFFVVLLLYLANKFEQNSEQESANWWQAFRLGIIATLVLLSRLDNIFLVCLLGYWIFMRPRYLRFLLLGDVVFTLFSVAAAFFWRLEGGRSYLQYADSAYAMAAAAGLARLASASVLGLYKHPGLYTVRQLVIRTALAGAMASGIITVVMTGLNGLGLFNGFPRMALLIDAVLFPLLGLGLRLLIRRQSDPSDSPDFSVPQGGFIPLMKLLRLRIAAAFAYFAPLLTTLLTYMAWNQLYFGTPTPISGQIKHWWGSLYTVYGRPVETWWGFLGFTGEGDLPWSLLTGFISAPVDALAQNDGQRLVITLGFTVLIFLLAFLALRGCLEKYIRIAADFNLLPLWAGCFFQISYYYGTGYVNTRSWYWVNENLLLLILLALLADSTGQKLGRYFSPRLSQGVAAGLAVVLLGYSLPVLFSLTPWSIRPGSERSYLGGITALEKATIPGALIGSPGGGVIAYFIHDRTVVNLDGLMNTVEYFQLLKTGQVAAYLDRIGLDYVYGTKYIITESEPYDRIFPGRLEEIGYVSGSYLFKYRNK